MKISTTTSTELPVSMPQVRTGAAATPETTGSGAAAADAAGGTASSAGASEAVNVSSISNQLQAAQASSASSSVYATNKVNEIKQAISEGRFQVNSEKVADGLLNTVHELLNSRNR